MKATAYRKAAKKPATTYGRALFVKVASPHQVLEAALEYAVTRGMNRCDKYNEQALLAAQRDTLLREVVESFWIALEDAGLEVE